VDTTSLAYQAGPAAAIVEETIAAALRRVARTHPGADALISAADGVRLTWSQLDAQVNKTAKGLIAAGVGRGDRVAIWGPNRADWVVWMLAIAQVGAIVVALNPGCKPDDFQYAIDHSGACLLAAASRHRSADYQVIVGAARSQLPRLRHAVFWGSPGVRDLLISGSAVSVEQYASQVSAVRPADTLTIQYTSGSTGRPKGVMLSHASVVNNALQLGKRMGYQPGDRVCVPVPLCHVFGMSAAVAACIMHAAVIVLTGESFDAETVLRVVERERCTSILGVPAMFTDLLEQQRARHHDTRTLRTGLMAGAPCPEHLVRQIIAELPVPGLCIGYGMTETSPCSVQTAPGDDLTHRTATLGRAVAGAEIKVIDTATGQTLCRGENGELCVRGYLVMQGYWCDPDRTAATIDPEGWLHTGDVGMFTGDGYVQVIGRIKDLIIRGGENIAAHEIEERLQSRPDVLEAYVIGVPDERLGEEVMAWVRLRTGAIADPERLRDYCRAGLAHYKVPRYVRIADDFPASHIGKVQKHRLREQAIAELGLRAHGQNASESDDGLEASGA
jgi:fatty-acyl-CoA synthase